MNEKKLLALVSQGGQLILRGNAELAVLRRAIRMVHDAEGMLLEFDPETPAELVDYLAVTSMRTASRAAQGALLGLLLGLLFRRPGTGAAIGAIAGGAVGFGEGVSRVKRGWRLKAGWDTSGQVWAQVEQYST